MCTKNCFAFFKLHFFLFLSWKLSCREWNSEIELCKTLRTYFQEMRKKIHVSSFTFSFVTLISRENTKARNEYWLHLTKTLYSNCLKKRFRPNILRCIQWQPARTKLKHQTVKTLSKQLLSPTFLRSVSFLCLKMKSSSYEEEHFCGLKTSMIWADTWEPG